MDHYPLTNVIALTHEISYHTPFVMDTCGGGAGEGGTFF
jgi:hypothetical protein